MTFAEAKAIKTELDGRVTYFASILHKIRGTEIGPMGLTPDHIKFAPEYRVAKANLDTAFKRLREFNSHYTKQFKTEIRADMQAKRQAK